MLRLICACQQAFEILSVQETYMVRQEATVRPELRQTWRQQSTSVSQVLQLSRVSLATSHSCETHVF